MSTENMSISTNVLEKLETIQVLEKTSYIKVVFLKKKRLYTIVLLDKQDSILFVPLFWVGRAYFH